MITKVKYKHNATDFTSSTADVEWWLRSAYCKSDSFFCCVGGINQFMGDGVPDFSNADHSEGFAPGFKIA